MQTVSKENTKEVEISSTFWPLQSTQPHTSAGLFIDPYSVAYACSLYCFEHLYSHAGVSVSREGECAVLVQPLRNTDMEWRYWYFLISANHLLFWLAVNLIFHISIFKECLRTLIGDWQLTLIFSLRGSQYGITASFTFITSSLKVLSSKFSCKAVQKDSSTSPFRINTPITQKCVACKWTNGSCCDLAI